MMNFIRVFLVIILAGFSLNSEKAYASKDDLCKSAESFFRSNGVAVSVFISHVFYPISAQSQTCPVETRVTDNDYRTVIAAMIVALGCEKNTKAFKKTLVLIDDGIKRDPLAEVTIKGIPKRYLSTDKNFCKSEELLQIKRCGVDPMSCKKMFRKLKAEILNRDK